MEQTVGWSVSISGNRDVCDRCFYVPACPFSGGGHHGGRVCDCGFRCIPDFLGGSSSSTASQVSKPSASVKSGAAGHHSCSCVEVSRRRTRFVAPRYFSSDGRCSGRHPPSTNEQKAYDLHEAWHGCGISKPQCGPTGDSDSASHSFPLRC